MTEFLDSSRPLPYCPGCGHPHVLKALDAALVDDATPRERYVLVTDIGCVGLADAYFPTLHTVHTLHGRAAAIAAGMRLAASSTHAHPLKPIVLVGDGGANMGLLHLVHAAQMDVDITVVVHNNLIYGMTGGQHSALTPEGMATSTTPKGCPIPPLDLGAVVRGAGCAYFARARAPGEGLAQRIGEALAEPGFAMVEALELCPTFAARIGGMTGKGLNELALTPGHELGVWRSERVRALPGASREVPVAPFAPASRGLAPHPAWGRLDRPVTLILAGKAGERVQSAARFAATAAMAAGLHATVRGENPVTQGRGFSVAELTLSPRPIDFTGSHQPEVVIVTAEEGAAELRKRDLLQHVGEGTRCLVDVSVPPLDAPCIELHDLRRRFGAKSAALGAITEAIAEANWLAPQAWEVALGELRADVRRATTATLEKAGIVPDQTSLAAGA